jgi:hypothetical protein
MKFKGRINGAYVYNNILLHWDKCFLLQVSG